MIKRDLYYERIPTKSLRNDVKFLGNTLGNVIKEGTMFGRLQSRKERTQKIQQDAPFVY